MTLPGGPADKLGNRYEKLWTISELREFHQTKRVNQSGKWSLAVLEVPLEFLSFHSRRRVDRRSNHVS